MKNLLIGMGTLALYSCVAHASPSQRELERVLAGVEHAPTADEVRRLGPGADAALIQYAGDKRATPVRRMRAIAALRFAPSANARAFLHEVVAQEGKTETGAGVLDLAAALSALAPYGHEELAVLLPYLTHPSADARQAAVVALSQLHDPEAEGPLRLRQAVEKDPGVRQALERALQK